MASETYIATMLSRSISWFLLQNFMSLRAITPTKAPMTTPSTI